MAFLVILGCIIVFFILSGILHAYAKHGDELWEKRKKELAEKQSEKKNKEK